MSNSPSTGRQASSTSPSSEDTTTHVRSETSLLQQPGPRLFFAGLLFASFSALSTRRALLRRRVQSPLPSTTIPHSPSAANPVSSARSSSNDAIFNKGQSTTPSTTASPVPEVAPPTSGGASAEPAQELQNNSMVLALEALSVATINVLSWGMVGIGGALWKWDIRGMDELRYKVRGGLGVDGTGRSENELEEEMEEWVVGVLARKEDKERLAQKIQDQKGRERTLHKVDRG